MPVTLNNTNITINDGTNNFVLETVKTHVPEFDIEVDIVPDVSFESHLIAWYKFEGTDENTIGIDSSGNGNDLVLKDNSNNNKTGTRDITVSGKFDNGFKFDGLEYFQYDQTSQLKFGLKTMTYSFWFNPNGATTYSQGATIISVRKWNVAGWSHFYQDTVHNFVIKRSNGMHYVHNTILNNWYPTDFNHLCYVFSYDGTNTTIKYYVNNILITTYVGDYTEATTSQRLQIGAADDYFIGQVSTNMIISDIRIYDRAFTQTEVSNLYNYNKLVPVMPLYETQTTVTQYPLLPADSTNLVAHYKFDDEANDSSGNDKHLTEYNITYENTDKIIGQSSFHNGSGYFEISNDGYFSPDIFSVSCWVKAYQQVPHQAIASCRTSSYKGWIIYILDNQITIFTGTGSNWIQTTTYPNFASNPPVWRHLVVVWNKSTSSLQIYVNGNLESTVSITGYTNNNITNLRIGAGKNETTVDFELSNNSLIDDFRIYDKALSAYEIDILANNKIENTDYNILTFEYQGPSYPVIDADAASLVAHYKFDDSLSDSMGNTPNLVLDSGSETTYTDGMINKSLDITGDKYKVTSESLVNTLNADEWTISFWYKITGNPSVAYNPIISRYDVYVAGQDRGGTNIQMINTKKIRINRWYGSGNVDFISIHTMIFNEWTYVTYVSKSDKITLYINQEFDNEGLLPSGNNWANPYSFTHNDVGFGCFQQATINATYAGFGYIDDFRIYDKALSATEISDLYNQYNQTSYTVNFQAESECDILIVGGGGGGGNNTAGGGGAGGYYYSV